MIPAASLIFCFCAVSLPRRVWNNLTIAVNRNVSLYFSKQHNGNNVHWKNGASALGIWPVRCLIPFAFLSRGCSSFLALALAGGVLVDVDGSAGAAPFVAVVLVGVGVAAPLAAPVGVDVDAPLVVLLEGTVVLAVAEGVAADES